MLVRALRVHKSPYVSRLALAVIVWAPLSALVEALEHLVRANPALDLPWYRNVHLHLVGWVVVCSLSSLLHTFLAARPANKHVRQALWLPLAVAVVVTMNFAVESLNNLLFYGGYWGFPGLRSVLVSVPAVLYGLLSWPVDLEE